VLNKSEVKITFTKTIRKTEFYIFLTLLFLCIAVQLRSGQFFTSNNIVDLLRSFITPLLFGFGALLVIISGGFDLSFPWLAALSYAATSTILVNIDYQGTVLLAFVMATVFGAVLGLLNGIIISRYKLPAMIVTLGTASIYRGLMLGVFDLREVTSDMPKGLIAFGDSYLFEVINPKNELRSTMPTTFVILIVTAFLVYFILRFTLFGRSLFAIGCSEEAAERAGYNVRKSKVLLYSLVGAMAGMAGIVRICMVHQSIPNGLAGLEMTVISAIILGGGSIFGGKGTVIGTILGIGLIVTMQNSMLLLGIPSYWQNFFTGLVILIGISVSAMQLKRLKGDRVI